MTKDNNIKYCPECNMHLSLDNFGKSSKSSDGFRRLCKNCTNLENKESAQILKLEVLLHYSPVIAKCACCGETNLEFLTLDHINNDGGKHRKEDPSARKLARWIKKNHFPSDFAVLCMNCNFAKGRFGYCPHKEPSQLIKELPSNFDLRKKKKWGSKLSLQDVLDIKELSKKSKVNRKELSEKYGVSTETIGNIIMGRRWKDV